MECLPTKEKLCNIVYTVQLLMMIELSGTVKCYSEYSNKWCEGTIIPTQGTGDVCSVHRYRLLITPS
jgi:hypothetical protein